MTNVNSTSLFHFTKRKNVFKKILSHGLRYSYSSEYRPENISSLDSIYRKNGIIIPLISFCDIPLIRTTKHQKKYGKYCLGLNKTFLKEKLKDTLDMVSYYSSDDKIQALCEQWEVSDRIIEKGFFEIKENPLVAMFENEYVKGHKLQKGLELLYAFFKPSDNRKAGKDYCNYRDENEWRAVLKENRDLGCVWNMKSSQESLINEKGKHLTIAQEAAKMSNETIGNNPYFYLQFAEKEIFKCITHILLPTENQADYFVSFILKSPCLFGIEKPSNNCRLNLIRKINSFEQIEKDF